MLQVDPKARPTVEDLIKMPKIKLRINERKMRDQYAKLKYKEQKLDKKQQELISKSEMLDKRETDLAEREIRAKELYAKLQQTKLLTQS